jgi:hypothetical protein
MLETRAGIGRVAPGPQRSLHRSFRSLCARRRASFRCSAKRSSAWRRLTCSARSPSLGVPPLAAGAVIAYALGWLWLAPAKRKQTLAPPLCAW